jgi:YegS/Rv2252/BmrU family lipid kinase
MTPSGSRPALIVNVSSRSGAAAFETARDTLTAYGVDLGRCLAVRPEAVRDAVKEAVQHGHRTLIVGGGDGTISCAAGLLADLPAEARPVLGVLPLGTANDFARTLGIPSRLEDACATIAGGKVVDVDLGRANGAPFLNAASVGLTAAVTRALRPGLKKRLGRLAYPLATLSAYREHLPFAARLTFPHGDLPQVELSDLLQVTVGNGRHYGGGNTVAPEAGIDDHRLDVYAIRSGRLRDYASIARRLRSGAFVEHDRVLHVTTRAVEVSTDEEHPVTLDGEPVGATPTLFEVERNAVDVIVPDDITHLQHDAGMAAGERGTDAS